MFKWQKFSWFTAFNMLPYNSMYKRWNDIVMLYSMIMYLEKVYGYMLSIFVLWYVVKPSHMYLIYINNSYHYKIHVEVTINIADRQIKLMQVQMELKFTNSQCSNMIYIPHQIGWCPFWAPLLSTLLYCSFVHQQHNVGEFCDPTVYKTIII